jgi:uncharacterized membrane protein
MEFPFPIDATRIIALTIIMGMTIHTVHKALTGKTLPEPNAKKIKWTAIVIIALGSALRIAGLLMHNTSLWDDEARTYLVVSTPNYRNMLVAAGHFLPDNAPLVLILNHSFMKILGTSIFAYMLPATIYSILGLVATYMLARKFLGPKTSLIVLLITALNLTEILYSMSGRNYAILSVLVPLNCMLFLRAINTKNKNGWRLYLLSLLLCIYAHYILISLFFIHTAYIALLPKKDKKHYKQTLKKLAIALGIALLFFTPLLLSYTTKLNSHSSRYIYAFTTLLKNPAFVYRTVLHNTSLLFFNLNPLILLLPYIYIALQRTKRGDPRDLLVLLYLTGGILFSAGATIRLAFYNRYVHYLLPFVIISAFRMGEEINSEIHKIAPRKKRLSQAYSYSYAGVVLLIGLNYLATMRIPGELSKNFDGNWKRAATHIESHYQRKDQIVVFDYFAANLAIFTELPLKISATQEYSETRDSYANLSAKTARESLNLDWRVITAEQLKSYAKSNPTPRFWLVDPDLSQKAYPRIQLQPLFKETLENLGYHQTYADLFEGLSVELYEKIDTY